MKQVYTVKRFEADDEGGPSIFLRESGHDTFCPNFHNDSNCGDWCPAFEFAEDNDGRKEATGYVMLHCCKRGVAVEVEE
jgi:hypothetical protein